MMDRPNITLRLLPFAVAEHPGINGAFSVLEFPDPDDGRIVCVEVLISTLYIEKTRDVGRRTPTGQDRRGGGPGRNHGWPR
ncbi:MAG: Scr1 family TA system antitoxin-like transcriptional regulator [Pseudonocardiaceae bacterium]